MRAISCLVGAALTFTVTAASAAPTHVSAPRSDGHATPLAVYEPVAQNEGCAPVAIISHGAGGSVDGYRYLADIMAGLGYRAIVMGHLESGPGALRADMRADGFRQGIAALVADPNAEAARLLDIGAALNWAESQCHSDFKVLLGHSMGSETVMLEAGARNKIAVPAPPSAQDRFDAYVALSPEGPGLVFPENAWGGVKKPILLLTGTRDQSLTGPPVTRQTPWVELPGNAAHCQMLGVFEGATHMNFGGMGPGADRVEPEVKLGITAFLSGVRAGACTAPPGDRDMRFSSK